MGKESIYITDGIENAGLSLCSVDLCFCTSGDGIDGSRRCFLEYVDSLHTTRRIILTGWRERREKRESERLVRVPVSYRGM